MIIIQIIDTLIKIVGYIILSILGCIDKIFKTKYITTINNKGNKRQDRILAEKLKKAFRN